MPAGLYLAHDSTMPHGKQEIKVWLGNAVIIKSLVRWVEYQFALQHASDASRTGSDGFTNMAWLQAMLGVMTVW